MHSAMYFEVYLYRHVGHAFPSNSSSDETYSVYLGVTLRIRICFIVSVMSFLMACRLLRYSLLMSPVKYSPLTMYKRKVRKVERDGCCLRHRSQAERRESDR